MKPSTVLSLFLYTSVTKKIMNVWSFFLFFLPDTLNIGWALQDAIESGIYPRILEHLRTSERNPHLQTPRQTLTETKWKINIQTACIGRLPCTCNSTTLSSHIHFKWLSFSFYEFYRGFYALHLKVVEN